MYHRHREESLMRYCMLFRHILIILLLYATVPAEPWFEDLETSIQDLPWICEGSIIRTSSSGISITVNEVFAGEVSPGDTLNIPFWEMGMCMAETMNIGENYLFIPDTIGSLQIVGTVGRGYWLLKGFFDFNAFFIEPGVLYRQELLLLCDGDTLPEREIEMELRFAGGSEFIDIVLAENSMGWEIDCVYEPLDGLELEYGAVILGGRDAYSDEPAVSVYIPLDGGLSLTLRGNISSCEDGLYRCVVSPTGPVILSSRDMTAYIEDGITPEPPVFDVHVFGADPVELGLAPEPYMTTDENGHLHLSGAGCMLDITSLYSIEYGARPAVGFDTPMTCSDPLYFDFSSLSGYPSGHLATDLIDVLGKGVVTGSLSADGDPEAPRFSLTMRSD